MGKLQEGSVLSPLQPFSPLSDCWQSRREEITPTKSKQDLNQEKQLPDWESVSGLLPPERRILSSLSSRGVSWKHPAKPTSEPFLLFHGGEVGADGNCLFSAAYKSLELKEGSPLDLRRRVVRRFREDYLSGAVSEDAIHAAIRNMYWPDLDQGWGVHFIQELKLLARKRDRETMDASIDDLVAAGLTREEAAERVYRERCVPVDDGESWAKYMATVGCQEEEYDIVSLQYVEEGLLSVDENRRGGAAAFGDDFAIQSLAAEFQREIFVVQVHGSDGEETMPFFLRHRPRGEVLGPPVFLLMRGRGWCGGGGDHFEPLIARAASLPSIDEAVVVL